MSLSTAVATPTAAEAASLFGRLAEKRLYLDPMIGACCHSACSDCEWRDPEGGYRFDLLTANNNKWIPCYFFRDFEDQRGSHRPLWFSELFPDSEALLTRVQFGEALQAIPFTTMPLGPKGKLVPETAALSPLVLDAFWSWLAGESSSLSASRMRERLQDMSLDPNRDGAVGEGPDSVDWKSFAKALGAPPFERW